MDDDILQAILNTYSRILREIDEIKRMIKDKTDDRHINLWQKYNYGSMAAGAEKHLTYENEAIASNVIHNNIAKTKYSNNKTVENSVQAYKYLDNHSPEPTATESKLMKQSGMGKISSKPLNSHSQARARDEEPINMETSTQLTKKPKNNLFFNPALGAEIDRCYSQGDRSVLNSQEIPIRCKSRRTSIQETYNPDQWKDDKVKLEFFGTLQKEVEEAL